MAFRSCTAKCDGIITTPTLITAEPQVFTVHFDHPPHTAVSRAASQQSAAFLFAKTPDHD